MMTTLLYRLVITETLNFQHPSAPALINIFDSAFSGTVKGSNKTIGDT